MKTSILFFLVSICSTISAQVVPTCSIDPISISLGISGVTPFNSQYILNGSVGGFYKQSLTVTVPVDTIINALGPVKICYTRWEIVSNAGVQNYGLPAGLNLAGEPLNLKFPAGTTGCLIIYGTPSVAGTFNLGFSLKYYGIPINSGNCPSPPSNINLGSVIYQRNYSQLELVVNSP